MEPHPTLIASIPSVHNTSLSSAFNAGFDAGKNGANTTNCHFKFFGSRELTNAWEAGKRAAESRKEKP